MKQSAGRPKDLEDLKYLLGLKEINHKATKAQRGHEGAMVARGFVAGTSVPGAWRSRANVRGLGTTEDTECTESGIAKDGDRATKARTHKGNTKVTQREGGDAGLPGGVRPGPSTEALTTNDAPYSVAMRFSR